MNRIREGHSLNPALLCRYSLNAPSDNVAPWICSEVAWVAKGESTDYCWYSC